LTIEKYNARPEVYQHYQLTKQELEFDPPDKTVTEIALARPSVLSDAE